MLRIKDGLSLLGKKVGFLVTLHVALFAFAFKGLLDFWNHPSLI